MPRKLPAPRLYLTLAATAVLSLALGVGLMARPTLAMEGADALPNGGIRALTQHEAEIRGLIERSGWVSPGLSKTRALYMISFRACPDCIRFEQQEFPALHKAGIDTRVIMVARRNRSTPQERAGVAELWARRDWKTFETWTGMPVDAWTAAGLPSGDDDPARAAEVEKGRVLVEALRPLLADNGVSFAYPILIWSDQTGHLHGCACEQEITYRYIRAELGLVSP